uniref:hypothetical protein n=1 Tax=Haloferax prahovense TaxID=381852 RepID=UPI00067825C1|nr:hypothetical protein [Haloferax prahovense]
MVQTPFDSFPTVVRSLLLGEQLDELFDSHSCVVCVTKRVQDVATSLLRENRTKRSDSVRLLL